MARDFDNFPTYDPLVKAGTLNMSGVWADFMATFVQTLQEYLSQNGMFVPRLTTTERDALRNVIGGQLIYNTSLNKFQGYEGNPLAWVNLV
jgi:hypothetical protein